MLTRDPAYLDLPRSQMDILISKGIETEGTLHVPYKYGDPGNYDYIQWIDNVITQDGGQSQYMKPGLPLWKDGWFEFQPLQPKHAVHVWSLSQNPQDLERILRIRNGHKRDWEQIFDSREKDQGGHDAAWVAYLRGEYPGYPEDILKYNLFQVQRRLDFMRDDTQDPKTYGDYYLQQRNPITAEGLTQLTLGASLPLYNGGLLMAPLRHFDRERKRPGLPADVAALVQSISPDRVVIRLVNLSRTQQRELTIQAGAYGEHQFKDASYSVLDHGELHTTIQPIDRAILEVDLPPGADITLTLRLERFVNDPSYRLPWDAEM
jgi:hypothetical protein